MTVLTLLLFLLLAGFVAVLLLPQSVVRQAAVAIAAAGLALSLALVPPFWQGAGREYQFVTDVPWIPVPAIRFHLGVDGISVWLVVLSALLTPLVMLLSWRSVQRRTKEFFALLLLLDFALVGVFAALDLFLFYSFFELTLVPILLLMLIWGGEGRSAASLKFFVYTLIGSLLMLTAIIYLYNRADTMQVPELLSLVQSGRLTLSASEQLALFLGFFIAFAIKLGLVPLHTWLPDSYSEAPTAGTVMLAALLSKMGTYGLLRFCLPLFPNAARSCADWIVALALIGIIYGALLALVQTNLKRLLAYSSISHIGFIVLGLFTFQQQGLDGAVYQMVSHGVSTGALFLLAGLLEERYGTTAIVGLGGIAHSLPRLSVVFMIALLTSIGLPSLGNFIGEYLVLQGAAQASFRWAVLAAIGVVLSACYMLWMYQRVFLGPRRDEGLYADLRGREMLALVPLVALMIWMGTGTKAFLPSISAANRRVLELSATGAEYQVRQGAPLAPTVTLSGVANAQ